MTCVASRLAGAGFLLCVLSVGCPQSAAADSQAQPGESLLPMPRAADNLNGAVPEQLPSPHELPSEIIISEDPYGFHPPTRNNRYDIWQLYAVGRFGQFRPRVIYSVYGSFYLYDGRPYPWVSTHQLDFALQIISP
jgi:hypothetical protein